MNYARQRESMRALSAMVGSLSQEKEPNQKGFAKRSRIQISLRPSIRRKGTGGRDWTSLSLVLCALLQTILNPSGIAYAASKSARKSSELMNWPSFRGPTAIGHAVHATPPLSWNGKEGKNIIWKSEVPKQGKNSPVVWGNRLFLTGADELSRQVYCFQRDTGELLWMHDAVDIPESPTKESIPDLTKTSGLAAPTPTTNGRYVAAIFATGDLLCVNMDGNRIWAKNLGIPNNSYGHASSLISHESLVFVQYDQKEDSKLLAFDLVSGDLTWEVKRGAISWSSPILVNNKGRTELIATNGKAVDSYDPKTGKLLWHLAGLSGEVAPSAAYADGVVYVANEYSVAAAIDVGSHNPDPKILWAWDGILPDAASPLANERYLVVPSGYGIVNCLDAKTGRVFWEHEFDEGFYSSPILVNDRVYVIDLSGKTRIFRMSDSFELLGTAEIGEEAYATPAYVGDRIFVRGATHLFCIGEQNGNGR